MRKLQQALSPIKTKFSVVLNRVDNLREQLARAQDLNAKKPQDPYLVPQEFEIRKEFLHWNRAAIRYMNQKLKYTWIVHGDTNTKFFHSLLKKQHYQKRVYTITSAQGEVITEYPRVVQ